MTLWKAFKYALLITLASVGWILLLWGFAVALQWMMTHWSVSTAILAALIAWVVLLTLVAWLLFRSKKV
jgi:hypothetical protein